MTRKDYVMISSAIKGLRKSADLDEDVVLDEVAIALGEAFKKDNPNFDYERFLRDTGTWS